MVHIYMYLDKSHENTRLTRLTCDVIIPETGLSQHLSYRAAAVAQLVEVEEIFSCGEGKKPQMT